MPDQMQDNPDQQPKRDRVRVFIEDHTGNKRREARVAGDAPVRELIPALISAMKLPATDPAGRPVTYHLAFDERQLQSNETLLSANISDGAVMTLVPEMTAGSNS